MMPYLVAIQLVVFASVIEAFFAAWARLYSHGLKSRRAESKDSEPALELRPVRWMSMVAAAARIAILIGINVTGLLHGTPLFIPSFVLYLGLTLIHGQVRFALEREIRRIE